MTWRWAAAFVIYVVVGLPVALNIGGRLAAVEWPSLHDRNIWRPEITQRLRPSPSPRFDSAAGHFGALMYSGQPVYIFPTGGYTVHEIRQLENADRRARKETP